MDKATPQDHRKPAKQAKFPDALGRARTCASKLVAGAGQRFESARRLSIFLGICRQYLGGKVDAGRHPGSSTATLPQPVWPKGLSAWRFCGFNNPGSERTSRLSGSRCRGRPAHITGPLLYFHITEVGAQTAPPVAPRPPPLQVRDRLHASRPSAKGSVVGKGLWFGPQTAPDGRPPALVEARSDA